MLGVFLVLLDIIEDSQKSSKRFHLHSLNYSPKIANLVGTLIVNRLLKLCKSEAPILKGPN